MSASEPKPEDGAAQARRRAKEPEPERTNRAVPVNRLVAALTAPSLRRRGFGSTSVLDHWPEIVGEQLARLCWPLRLSFPGKPGREGTLHLNVSGGAAATLLQPRTAEIIARANAFLGAETVSALKVHVSARRLPAHAEPWGTPAAPPPQTADQNDDDRPLDRALKTLGQSIRNRQQRPKS